MAMVEKTAVFSGAPLIPLVGASGSIAAGITNASSPPIAVKPAGVRESARAIFKLELHRDKLELHRDRAIEGRR